MSDIQQLLSIEITMFSLSDMVGATLGPYYIKFYHSH